MIPFISTPYGYELSPLRPRRSRVLVTFLSLTLIIALALPLPYVIFRPGTPSNVLGKMITVPAQFQEIDGAVRDRNGRLYLTTIFVTTPRTKVFGIEILDAWIRGDAAVYPRSVIYPEGEDPKEISAQDKFDMKNSQQFAIYNALTFLGYEVKTHPRVIEILEQSDAKGKLEIGDLIRKVDGIEVTTSGEIVDIVRAKSPGEKLSVEVERGVASEVGGDGNNERKRLTFSEIELIENANGSAIGIFLAMDFNMPIDVSIDIKRTGGPSAGMIFALGVIEKLTGEDLLRGRKIAGTGTIDLKGSIGPIGGIESKLIGAARVGATIFLAPRGNCDEIVHVPKGLQVIPVSTLEEAVEVLRDKDPSDRPACDAILPSMP